MDLLFAYVFDKWPFVKVDHFAQIGTSKITTTEGDSIKKIQDNV